MALDENTTLDELLSTINQTDNKTNNTGILNDTGISNLLHLQDSAYEFIMN